MWFFWIWFVGFLISFVSLIWWCAKDGKITLTDLGVGLLIGCFSWISVIVEVIMLGENIIIWRKK